jgi:FG-GAP-like repeat
MRRKLFPLSLAWLACAVASAATLDVKPAPELCGVAVVAPQAVPAAAASRIPGSQAVSGSRNIPWVWLGSPTNRYSHDALGSSVHAASLHAIVVQADGTQRTLSLELPPDRVFEDRLPRLADLDGDGRDEIILVESDVKQGSSLVVYGLRLGAAARQPVLAQLARGPFTGTAQSWLNPAGIADFDGDGRPDIAAVLTPHVGGVLTLYRYQPPVLEPAAQRPGFANHRMGTAEQQLSAIVASPGQRPALILPGAGLRSLHVVRLGGAGEWKTQLTPVFLPAQVQRITALPGGACVLLTNGVTLQATLRD